MANAHIILGDNRIDGGWIDIDLTTGEVTHHGGNVGGPSFDDFKHVVAGIRHASEIKDPEVRRQAIRALGSALKDERDGQPGGPSGIFGPNGNVIAIF